MDALPRCIVMRSPPDRARRSGLFVFLLFPARKRGARRSAMRGPPRRSARVQQRRLRRSSLVAAAPKGYVGWLEKQIVLAGRPDRLDRLAASSPGSSSSRSSARCSDCCSSSVGGPQPFKVLLAVAGTILAVLPARRDDQQSRARSAGGDQARPARHARPDDDRRRGRSRLRRRDGEGGRGGKGPLAEELIRVLQDMSIGRTRRDAFLRARASHELRGPPPFRPRDHPGRRVRRRDR